MKNIALPIILTIFIYCNCNGQNKFQDYLLGRWSSVDSVTGKKTVVEFDNDKTLVFDSDKKNRWEFVIQESDSLILLEYKIALKRATLNNAGTLVIKSNNCFWWFNPNSYKTYLTALEKGYSTNPEKEFDKWLKRNRDVFYRLRR